MCAKMQERTKKVLFVMSDRFTIQELRDEVCRLIDVHLPHFQVCRREALKSLVRGLVEGCIFYLVQGLCDYYKKSLATGERFEGQARASCPSAMMYDCIIAPLIQKLDAVEGMENMRGPCERTSDDKNCVPARAREADALVPVYIAIARLIQRLNGVFVCHIVGGQSVNNTLVKKLMKSMKSAGVEIIFVNPDSFHFSFYGYISTTTFFTKDLQQSLIFQDFSQLIDDYNNVIDIVNSRRDASLFVQPVSFADMIKLTPSLPGVKDLSSKSKEELAALQAEYESLCAGRSIDNQRRKQMKRLQRDIEETKANLANATTDSIEIQGRLSVLETELALLESQPKANAEFIEKRRQESEDKRLAEEVKRQERAKKKVTKEAEKEARKKRRRESEAKHAEEEVKRQERAKKKVEKEAEEEARKKRRRESEAQRVADAKARLDAVRAEKIAKGVALAEVKRRLNLATKNDNETLKQQMERVSSNKEVFAVIINHTFSFAYD
jgi:hypothetical protein